MVKYEINALISYSKDTLKQPILNLERVANLKANMSIFMEMFFTETGGKGSPPARCA